MAITIQMILSMGAGQLDLWSGVLIMQWCRQLSRIEGGKKVKTKELQFGSRGWEAGEYAPSARSVEAKNFFKIQEV